MGIRGLNGYIYRNNLYKLVDLVSIARKQGEKMKIIVDAKEMSKFLIDIMLKKMASHYSNNFLKLPVGEYKEMESIFEDFHESLNEINIELIWVVDGPMDFDLKHFHDNLPMEWAINNEKIENIITKILSGCRSQVYNHLHKYCRPVFYFNAALKKLKECGARIIHLPPGEADAMMVRIYKDEGAFAILAGDSDFVIYNHCNVILSQVLKKYHRGDLNLPFVNVKCGERLFQAPIIFECPLTNSNDIIRHLQLRDHEQLMMLAVMVGNNYTEGFTQEVCRLCNVKKEPNNYANFESMVEYIKAKKITFETYARSLDLREFFQSHQTFQRAITYSREMYLSDGSFSYESSDALTSFLNHRLQLGDINKDCITIHYHIYYHSIYVEELPKGCEGIIAALHQLRAQVYPFLTKNDDVVTEVLPRGEHKIVRQLFHTDRKTHQISMIDGINIFLRIFSVGFSDNFKFYINELSKKDITKVYVTCIIAYFYKITHGVNLMVTESEFKAVFITAFFQLKSANDDFQPILDNGTFMGLKICPSPRCVTIATWVMVLYQTAVNICGGALNITTSFPPPSTIMKGSVLFAFFETMDGDSGRTRRLDCQDLENIELMKESIMAEFQEIYNLITN